MPQCKTLILAGVVAKYCNDVKENQQHSENQQLPKDKSVKLKYLLIYCPNTILTSAAYIILVNMNDQLCS